jgi:hypothetical protein
MKILLCGDSYVQDNNLKHTWPTKLANTYETTNLACSGTGPQWSLNQLRLFIENNDTSNTKLLFFVSAESRLDLACVEQNKQWTLRESNNKNIVWLYKNYVFTDSFRYLEQDKIISCLGQYAKYFDNVLIWNIFGQKTKLKYSFDCNVDYINESLYSIEYESIERKGRDTLNNHLHDENHQVMYDQLSNWIQTRNKVNIKKFVKIY